MASLSQDSDIHVSFEDQQKINRFARQNALLEDLGDQLKAKEKEQQDLDDAESDLLMAEPDSNIPYKLGDVFICLSVDEAQQMIEVKKALIQEDVSALNEKQEAVKKVMSDLKVMLYAKFGNNINLEADDS